MKRWWLLAPALHLLGLALYLDWAEVLTNPPVVDTDHAMHWAQVWAVSHFLDTGHLWGYDPYFMAGWPAGTLFDVDNKLVEVASWALSRAGLPLPLSYNLVLLGLIVLAPLAFYPAARWLGLEPKAAALAQLAALALWYFDPALRWAWQGGTFAFAAAVCAALLVVAAAAQLTAPGTPLSKRPALWLAWFGLGAALFWLHALTFVVLLAPLAVLTIQRWPGLGWPRRSIILLWPPLVVLANLPWLLPAWRFAWAGTITDKFLQGGLPALAADLLGLGRVDGAARPGLLGLRWLVLVAGSWGLWRLARRDAGFRAVAAGAWLGLLLAYFAVHLPGGERLEPYRYIFQAASWPAVGLSAGLGRLRRLLAQHDPGGDPLRGWRRGLAAGLIGLAVLWVGRAAWQFRPPPLGGPAEHRWQGPSPEVRRLCRHLRELPANSGRVLVDDWRVGALLPWCSDAQVIGGPFGWVWTEYGYSNASIWEFLRMPYPEYTVPMWQSALATYDVRWLVANQEWQPATLANWLAAHPDQATPGPTFGRYRLYAVRPTGARIAVRADYDGLAVTADPAEAAVVLPYHWLPTLRARPAAVRLQPQRIGRDPIPFIRVEPAGIADFTVCNYTAC